MFNEIIISHKKKEKELAGHFVTKRIKCFEKFELTAFSASSFLIMP